MVAVGTRVAERIVCSIKHIFQRRADFKLCPCSSQVRRIERYQDAAGFSHLSIRNGLRHPGAVPLLFSVSNAIGDAPTT